jgi:hypothetical protein
MAIFETTINIGIGDLIYTHAILETGKNKYDQMCINLNYKIIDNYRGGSTEYKVFSKRLSRLIFNDPVYCMDTDTNYPVRREAALLACGFTFRKPNLPQLCNPKSSGFDKNCIVVMCKIRDYPKSACDEIINPLIQKLNTFNGKIVILGEREIEMNVEYTMLGNARIYNIYNNWIAGLSNEKIIDITVPKLGLTPPNLEKLMADCAIIRDCRGVILIGIGGGSCLATAVSNRIVGISQGTSIDCAFWNNAYKIPTNEVMITQDKTLFFKNVDGLIA